VITADTAFRRKIDTPLIQREETASTKKSQVVNASLNEQSHGNRELGI
jgi:hypothetical protein